MNKKTKKDLINIAKKVGVSIDPNDKKDDIILKLNIYQANQLRLMRYGGLGSILPYESGIGGAYAQPSFGYGHNIKKIKNNKQ